jgi:hypothetical protein
MNDVFNFSVFSKKKENYIKFKNGYANGKREI